MNDIQIEKLKSYIRIGHKIAWNPNSTTCRIVVGINKHAEEGDDEMCAIFSNGEYAALYNCDLSEFAIIQRLE